MAESAWIGYVQMIIDKYDWETMGPLYSGACEAAAIYGQDGSAWAWSLTFPDFTNEFDRILLAADGNSDHSEVVCEMGNKKYSYVAKDHKTGVVILSRFGGGAALAKTKTGLIFGLYENDKPTSNPKIFQSAALCAELVANMCEYLKDQGY